MGKNPPTLLALVPTHPKQFSQNNKSHSQHLPLLSYLQKLHGKTPGRKVREIQAGEGMGNAEQNSEHKFRLLPVQHHCQPPALSFALETAPGAAPEQDFGKGEAQEGGAPSPPVSDSLPY